MEFSISIRKVVISFMILLSQILSVQIQGKSESTKKIKSPEEALKIIDPEYDADDFAEMLVPALQNLKSSGASYRDSLPYYCARALDKYGWSLLQSGNVALARQMFEEALIYSTPNDSILYMSILSANGYISLQEGRHDAAKEALEKVAAFHRSVRDSVAFCKDLANLGAYFHAIDNEAMAASMMDSALKIAIASKDPSMISVLKTRMSGTAKNPADAIRSLKECIGIQFDNNLTHFYPSTYLALAKAQLQSKEIDAALESAKISLEYADKYSQTELSASAHSTLAELYGIKGEWQLAFASEREARRALEIQKKDILKRASLQNKIAGDLSEWCSRNVVSSDKGFIVVDDNDGDSSETGWMIAFFSLVFFFMTVGFYIYIRFKRIDDKYSAEVSSLKASDSRHTAKEKDMSKTIAYLIMFYNNHNGLLGKIREQVLKCLGKDNDQNTKIRNTANFITNNLLSQMESDFIAEEKKEEDEFIDRLNIRYPDLTEGEKLMCRYLRLGLSTQEICVLTGNQARSVNMSRYRLRQSLNLEQDENLEAAIKRI